MAYAGCSKHPGSQILAGSTPVTSIMAKKLWAIKVVHGKEDRGWVIERGLVVAVYDDKDYAEKEAKWLTDFQKKCGSKGTYEVKKWIPEEGVETALQIPPTSKRSSNPEMPKMVERRTVNESSKSTPKSSAAPMATIPTNLSDLFIGSSATDGTD